ncbi:LamG-like jellyroll fold domain-containing protein [Kitasatospora sp. NPDC091335]|uniref:LamG-like jellyroll fold domain-containing protein n=1 Tax=Kitasatospora sp. NPDC091335 TaxID=3364085 RepID=UPI003809ACD1
MSTTYVQPKRVRKNGQWADIDLALGTRPNGAVAPKVTTADVEFAGGGKDQPLVRMVRAGKELRLDWPKPLPAPAVTGDTAEYRSVLPDVDLRLTATRTGFSQVLVVHTAAAAKSPELKQISLGLKGSGLTVKQEADGAMTAVDTAGGGTVFEAPAPIMWDSGAKPGDAAASAEPAGPAAKSLAVPAPSQVQAQEDPAARRAPTDGSKVAPIKVDVPQSQDRLLLTPDQAMLADPATVYPVMIDPSWNTPTANDWLGVQRAYPNASYWHFNGSHDFGVGYCDTGLDPACAANDVKRVLFQIPNGSFKGKRILSAEFGTYESWSASCNAREIELWSTGYVHSKVNWTAQNAAGFWSRNLQTMNVAKGWSGNCPGGWLEFGGTSGNVKNLVQDAANWGWPTITFGLRAKNESDGYGWKRLTDDAFLRVHYNLPPLQAPMSDLSMSPGSVCQTSPVRINRVPQITVRLSDPDGEAIGPQFALSWDPGDGGGLRRMWWSTGAEGNQPPGWSFKGSGSQFSYPLPDSTPQNVKVGWEARAWDGAQWGPWSSVGDPTNCYFILDTTRPNGPDISSVTYPGSKLTSDELPWIDGVGRYGYFTVSSASTDVVKYQVGLDTGPSANRQVSTTGGAARNIRILPETPGPHFLSVNAIDANGNASQSETYYFNVLAGQPQRAGWKFDEAAGATESVGAGGDFEAVLGTGAKTGTEPGHSGNALKLDGTADGYAQTLPALLETQRSFTASAWVRYDGTAGSHAVLSQGGSNHFAFRLGVDDVGGQSRWTFKAQTAAGDSGATVVGAQSTTAPTVGRWTHLLATYKTETKEIRLYVDGALAASAPVTAVWDGHGPLQIGRSRCATGWCDAWPGAVDDVQLWDSALSATEAQTVFAGGVPGAQVIAKAKWSMEEPVGASSVVGHPQSVNAVLQGGATLGGPGVTGTGLGLDGVDDHARVALPPVLTTRSFAVAAWARLPKVKPGHDAVVLSQAGTHSSPFSLYYSAADDRWVFGRYEQDATGATLVRALQGACGSGPCLTPTGGEWAHLVGVYDAGTDKLRLYVNGYLAGESAYTASLYGSGPLLIGAGSREGQKVDFLPGSVDEVRVYDRVVTGPEVRDLVQQRPLLAGRWKFNSANGAAAPDEGPAKADAVLAGGASIKPDGGLLPTLGTLALDGSTGYAATTSTPLHTGQSFTLAGWANTAGVPTRKMTVMSVAGTDNSAVTLRWVPLGMDPVTGQPTGQWEAEVSSSDANGAAHTLIAHTPATAVQGEYWTHLAVSYDAFVDRLTLYANGQAENQGCGSDDFGTPTPGCTPHISWADGVPQPYEAGGGVQFGRSKKSGAWDEYFSGELDDVWLYQGVLSPLQIGKLAGYNVELDTSIGV